MYFKNRADAAVELAERLMHYRRQHPLVVGVPRGGVPMARIVADALAADLDVVLVRKLGAPGQPELAIGAVDESGTVLEGNYFALAPASHVREEVRTQCEILRMRRQLYRKAQPPIDPAGRVVIIVDDGVATGSSMLSAVHAIRARRPKTIVVALAVAPPSSLAALRAEADDVICLHAPPLFLAVGRFFEDFSEVTDAMVVAALQRAAGKTAQPNHGERPLKSAGG